MGQIGKKIKGFGLLEILIVIAIISVIAVVAQAVYSNYISRSKLVEIEYLDSVDSRDISIYLSENNGTFGSESDFNNSLLKNKIEANDNSDCIVSKTVHYIDSQTISINNNIDTTLC